MKNGKDSTKKDTTRHPAHGVQPTSPSPFQGIEMCKENTMDAMENQAPKKKRPYTVTDKVRTRPRTAIERSVAARKEKAERNAEMLGKFMPVNIPKITFDKIDQHTDGGKISRWKVIDSALDFYTKRKNKSTNSNGN